MINLFEEYDHYSGYKLNVLKRQTLTFDYLTITPFQEIKAIFSLKWKYLGVNLTKNTSTIYKTNYEHQSEYPDVER